MDAANVALRTARQVLNLGQADLAEAINRSGREHGVELRCTVRQVSKWERGETAWPQARYRRALEGVLGIPSMMLGFRPPDDYEHGSHEAGGLESSSDGDQVLRREFLSAAATLAGVAATQGMPARAASGKTQAIYADELQSSLFALERLERKFGSGDLLPLIDRQVAEITGMLDRGHDSSVITSVAAKVFDLAGWFYFDAGHHERARGLYKEALFLAQSAGDKQTTLTVAADMSMLSNASGRPREAIHLAAMMTDRVPKGGPVASLLAIREAQGWGQLGAERETLAAVRRAHTTFASVGPNPEWSDWYTEGELAGGAAVAMSNLGNWDSAEKHGQRAVADEKLPLRARTSFAILLGTVRAQKKDLDGTHDAMRDVWSAVPIVASDRIGKRLEGLRAVVQPQRGAKAVELRQQLLACA